MQREAVGEEDRVGGERRNEGERGGLEAYRGQGTIRVDDEKSLSRLISLPK